MKRVIYAERGEYSDYCMKILAVAPAEADMALACQVVACRQAEAWHHKVPFCNGDLDVKARTWKARLLTANDAMGNSKLRETDWVILDGNEYRVGEEGNFNRAANLYDWRVTYCEVAEWPE